MLEVAKALDEFEVNQKFLLTPTLRLVSVKTKGLKIHFKADKAIGCVIISGRGSAFAAGADIKEMLPLGYADCAGGDFLSHWGRIAKNVKPVIGENK